MLLKQQLGRESMWASCCWPLPSHSLPLWGSTSITCSGRNPWWVSVGITRQKQQTVQRPTASWHPFHFQAVTWTMPLCIQSHSKVLRCAAREWRATYWSWEQWTSKDLKVLLEDSWRPQSPAVFACVMRNYLVFSCILWPSMEHVPRSWSVCSSWQS